MLHIPKLEDKKDWYYLCFDKKYQERPGVYYINMILALHREQKLEITVGSLN